MTIILYISLTLALMIAGSVIAYSFNRLQQKYYATQYLFFIRYPLLVGTVFLLLPYFGPRIAPGSLKNIFVVGPIGTFFVVFVGCLLGWVIVYTARLVWISAPYRNGLYLEVETDNAKKVQFAIKELAKQDVVIELPEATRTRLQSNQPRTPGALLRGRWYFLGIVLALPLASKLVLAAEEPWYITLVAAIFGASAGAVVQAGAARLGARQSHSVAAKIRAVLPNSIGLDRFVARVKSWMLDAPAPAPAPTPAPTEVHPFWWVVGLPFRAISKLPPDIRAFHVRATGFFAGTMGVYLGIGLLSYPGFRTTALDGRFPALLYVLLLIMLLTWVLGLLSFQFDKTRIPGVAILAATLIGWQMVWPTHHVYQYGEWPDGSEPISAHEYLSGWTEDRAAALDPEMGSDPPMVLVAASGGGIGAALWTAQVLTGLEREIDGFGRHVALLSSVSGGGVGGLLWIDAFEGGGVPHERLDEIVAQSGASSLAAAAWGLAYPDVLRSFLGRLLGRYDRGWAQELRWQQHHDGEAPTLGSWAEDVYAFRRPAQIFNVTLQETGGRMLLSPVRFDSEEPLDDLFSIAGARADLDVTTAARLSSTFPYISPQARPEPKRKERGYHASDGGYYDNSGIVSLLDITKRYLEDVGPDARRKVTRKIALIQIRADAPPELVEEKEVAAGNFGTSMLGPIETLYNVRSSTQAGRNRFEVELALEKWNQSPGAEIRHFEFHLNELQVLSWHLTRAEKRAIRCNWPLEAGAEECEDMDTRGYSAADARRHNAKQLRAVQAFLGAPEGVGGADAELGAEK